MVRKTQSRSLRRRSSDYSISPYRSPILELLQGNDILPASMRDLHDKISFYAMDYDERKHNPVELIIEGDLEYLNLLHSQGELKSFGKKLIDNAITFGRLDVAKWLKTKDYKASSNAFDNAAANGDMEALLWLSNVMKIKGTDRAPVNAALKNHLEVLQWLISKGYNVDNSLFDRVAAKGHMNIILYLDSIGVRGTNQAVDNAAFEGHTHILKWLLENGYGTTRYTMSFAEQSGNPYTSFYLKSVLGEQ